MSARITGDGITHALSEHDTFALYAYTLCHKRMARRAWPGRTDEIAEMVDDPVDCMTCLVRQARQQDPPRLTNLCGETWLEPTGAAAPCRPQDDPSEPEPLPTDPANDPRLR